MTLEDIRKKIKEKFLFKICRTSGTGVETTYDSEGNAVVRIMTDEFKKVVAFELDGQPSAWNWWCRLIYEDGTISALFTTFKEVEVKKE